MHSFAIAQAFVMVSLGLGKPNAADGNRPGCDADGSKAAPAHAAAMS